MSKKHKKEKKKLLIIILCAIAVIFVGSLILVLGVYKYEWNNPFMRGIEKIIPFPGLYIRGAGAVTMGEIKNDVKAVQKFYDTQDFGSAGMRVDFTTEQGKKRLKVKEKDVVNKLIENKIIENLAKQRGIEISDSVISQTVDDSVQQFGNQQNLMSELGRLYGWTLEDFKQKVVKPELYGEKLSETYASEIDTTQQQEKIKSLYDRVTTKKEDFTKVAKESSEGQSSENGGDLGWSSRDQLITEVGDAAFSMNAGQISNIIESPLGFHIIKLEEKKNDGEQDLVHIRQIFIKKDTFADWLKNQIKKYPVTVFLKDYQWNASEGQLEFKNEDLRQFEANLDINSEGDPSIF